MSQAIETKDMEVNGKAYRVQYFDDADMDAPWDNSDCHGIVTQWTNRDKAPGELILHASHGSKRFYDFAETMKKAHREGWGLVGDTEGVPRGEIVRRAVMADFERLKAWCNDEWSYIGIVVFPLTEDGDELKSKSKSVWGIESDSGDYLDEVARELIDEIEGK